MKTTTRWMLKDFPDPDRWVKLSRRILDDQQEFDESVWSKGPLVLLGADDEQKSQLTPNTELSPSKRALGFIASLPGHEKNTERFMMLLGLSGEDLDYGILRCAVEISDWSTIQILIQRHSEDVLLKMIKSHNFQLLLLAASRTEQHVRILEWMFILLKPQAEKDGHPHPLHIIVDMPGMGMMSLAEAFCIFGLQNKWLPLLDWLAIHARDQLEQCARMYDYLCFRIASWGGFLDGLKWLEKHLSVKEVSAALKALRSALFARAIQHRQQAVLDWLREKIAPPLSMEAEELEGLVRYAFAHHDLKLLNWVLPGSKGRLLELLEAKDSNLCTLATLRGQVEILDWIHQQYPTAFSGLIARREYEIFHFALRKGHDQFLDWLWHKLEAPQAHAMLISRNGEALLTASGIESSRALHWWLEHAGDEGGVLLQRHAAAVLAKTAAQDEKMTALTLLCSQLSPERVFALALEEKSSLMLRALKKHDEQTFLHEARRNKFDWIHRLLSQQWLEGLQCLHELVPQYLTESGYLTGASNLFVPMREVMLNEAMMKADVLTIQWLVSILGELDGLLRPHHYHTFHLAVVRGDFEILQWLCEQSHNPIEMLNSRRKEAFYVAITQGHEAWLRWVWQKWPEMFRDWIKHDGALAFHQAIAAGQLKVLEIFKEFLRPSQLSVLMTSEDYEAFHLALQQQRLEVVEWLLAEAGELQAEMVQSRCGMAFDWLALHPDEPCSPQLQAILTGLSENRLAFC